MANTFKFGNGNWAVKDGYALAYNDENNNFKPLPFDFTRASSATTLNKQGLIETVGSGKPRIDFTDNTSGHLLLEPSRMNKLVRSNEFNTTWTLGSALTLTSGQTSTLTGNSDSWLLSSNGTSGFSALTQAVSISGSHTYSIFAKKGTNDLISLRSLSGADARAEFNLNTGVLNSTSNTSSTEIKSYGNGWYRISMTFSASNSFVYVYPNSIGVADAGNIYIQNAQIEAASYATSYIPTEGSNVTRIAETGIDCLLPNETIINNSTATVYLEFEALVNDLSNRWISFEELGVPTDNMFEIRLSAGSNLLQIVTRSSGGGQDVVMSETLTDITANNKIAVNYNGLNWKLAVNGTIADTETAARLFNDNIEKIKFSRNTNTNHFYGKVKDLKVYNTALTDTELQNLTS